MATTGFWPVKGSLKKVIDYADNPDKTTERKYLDDDLAQVLRYAQNDDKTDQRMFVSGINCSADHAYEDMMATKRRFGKTGGNVAYHGYQSFRPDEVTPEEAHQIGIQTAREMWGDEYEVVVTTHLNTTSVHNHLVVNSVSFKTGKKFENHVKDHYRLREISDRFCREHQLSVLENKPFQGSERKAYWVRKAGKQTHRDILKQDIEYCVKYALRWSDFLSQLESLGYSYDSVRHSVKAEGWERAVRLDRMGYSRENIQERIRRNLFSVDGGQRWNAHLPYKPKQFPLLELEEQMEFTVAHSHDTGVVMLNLLFLIVIRLLHLTDAERNQKEKVRPLSPSIRMALARLDEIQEEYLLLHENGIQTDVDLSAFIHATEQSIQQLEAERQHNRNLLRRPKSRSVEAELRQRNADISARLKPLRSKLKIARRTAKDIPTLANLYEQERAMEQQARQRNKNRDYVR